MRPGPLREAYGTVQFSLKVGSGLLSQSKRGWAYRKSRFGKFGPLVYFLALVDTDSLQELHWNINVWTDEEILNWKASHLSTSNAIAVAGAIFASVGLSALSLPHIYDVHWSARALCSSSMILGILSVVMATSQQTTIGNMNNPVALRLWLSRGAPQEVFPPRVVPYMMRPRPHWDGAKDKWTNAKYCDHKGFRDLPLESSISALKYIQLPRWLLSFAVILFIVGFGLYWLFLWVESVSPNPVAERNTFIVFLVTVVAFVLYWFALWGARMENDNRKAAEFDLGTLNTGFTSDTAIKQLEADLDRCQDHLNLARQWRERKAAYQSAQWTGAPGEGPREAYVNRPAGVGGPAVSERANGSRSPPK